jgi:hypothetical protein
VSTFREAKSPYGYMETETAAVSQREDRQEEGQKAYTSQDNRKHFPSMRTVILSRLGLGSNGARSGAPLAFRVLLRVCASGGASRYGERDCRTSVGEVLMVLERGRGRRRWEWESGSEGGR